MAKKPTAKKAVKSKPAAKAKAKIKAKAPDAMGAMESDAMALVQAAVDMARANAAKDTRAMGAALDDNLQLWGGIKTMGGYSDHPLAEETKKNIAKLGDWVTSSILAHAAKMPEKTLESMVNANLQVAEGLMECARMNSNENEEEALSLMQAAMALYEARDSRSKPQALLAMDRNLKMWVGIRTIIGSVDNRLPKSLKDDIGKVADYVAATTLRMKSNLDPRQLDVMAGINLQIAEGLLEGENMSELQSEAFTLLQAAVDISQAREKRDGPAMTKALCDNMNIWVGIKTLMQAEPNHLSAGIRDNLIKLADYNTAKIVELGRAGGMDDRKINTLINSNLQVSEGLLERSNAAALTRVV